jgi:putative chitinase
MKIDCLWNFLPRNLYYKLPYLIDKYKINTPNKLAHFLGQIKTESNFEPKIENLNYSADGILKVFGKYVKSKKVAKELEYNPVKLANVVYKNIGGYKFIGRGLIQLTSERNYKLFSDHIGEDCVNNPDLILTKYPYESSAWYFSNFVGKDAELPINFQNVSKVTGHINKKKLHLNLRYENTLKYYSIINCNYNGTDYWQSSTAKNNNSKKPKKKKIRIEFK